MVKRTVYSLAMALAAFAGGMGLTSCSSDELPSGTVAEGSSIGFSTSVGGKSTRGTLVTPSNHSTVLDNFQVWGCFSSSSTGLTPGRIYIGSSEAKGATIVKTDGKWTYQNTSDIAFWPAENSPLNVQAVAPASDASFSVAAHVADNIPCVYADVTVPATVTDQKDIMFASLTDQVSSTNGKVIGLTFSHAMSAIRFSAKLAKSNYEVNVAEVTLCNISAKGKVGYLSGNTLSSEIDASPTYNNFPAGLKASDIAVTSTAADITADNGTLIMLPQTTTPWTAGTTIAQANAAHQAYVKIKCKIKLDGTYIVGSSADYGYIYTPLEATWEMGKKYTYTLKIGTGEGVYDENGQYIGATIEFEVSGVDWQEGSSADIP